MMLRLALLTIAFGLIGGCASRQHEYIGQDGVRRPRNDAEKAYVQLLVPVGGPQLDKPLKALHTPFPDYPRDLRNAGIVGSVRTRFSIDEEGKVSTPTVLGSPHPTLAGHVLQSIMRWRFEPPVANGKPTRAMATHEFVFKVE